MKTELFYWDGLVVFTFNAIKFWCFLMKFMTIHKIHSVTVNIDISFRLKDFQFVLWKACHSSWYENGFLLHRSRKWIFQIYSTNFKRRNAGPDNFQVFLITYDIMRNSVLMINKYRSLQVFRIISRNGNS